MSHRSVLGRLPAQATITALVAFGIFAATLPYELVWDDNSLLAWVTNQESLGALLRAEFQMKPDEHMGYYRPVVLLSLWVDSRLGEVIPWAFHLTNVLLHTAVSILVLVFLRGLMGGSVFALGGALLFAVHPVHTEAVAFVSGRTDLWATLFVLIAAILWARARAAGPGKFRVAYIGSLVAFLAGVLSKEVSLMLPATLLAADASLPKITNGWWRRNGRWVAGWAAVVALAAFLRWGVADVSFGLGAGGEYDRMIALVSQPALIPQAVILYLRLLVIPWPLNAYYAVGDLGIGWISLLAAAALVATCLVLARGRDRWHGLVPLAWVLLFLVPVLGLVRISSAPVAERFLYLPSVGVALLVAAVVERGSRRLTQMTALWLAVATVGIVFGAATVARAPIWRDGTALFADLAHTSPAYVAKGHSNMGFRLHQLGRYEEALGFFDKALALQPESPEILTNMGTSLLALDRITEAEEVYRRAIAVRADSPEAHFGLGVALLREGRLREAAEEVRYLDDLSPQFAAALRQQIGVLSR